MDECFDDEVITQQLLHGYGCSLLFFDGTLLVVCPGFESYRDIAFRVACRPQDILALSVQRNFDINSVMTVTDGKRDRIELRRNL